LAALKAGLKLTGDQESKWPAFQDAMREMAKFYMDQSAPHTPPATKPGDAPTAGGQEEATDPVANLTARAENLAKAAAMMKKVADAVGPLYSSLDESQKQSFAMLAPPILHEHMAAGDEMNEAGMGGGMQGGMEDGMPGGSYGQEPGYGGSPGMGGPSYGEPGMGRPRMGTGPGMGSYGGPSMGGYGGPSMGGYGGPSMGGYGGPGMGGYGSMGGYGGRSSMGGPSYGGPGMGMGMGMMGRQGYGGPMGAMGRPSIGGPSMGAPSMGGSMSGPGYGAPGADESGGSGQNPSTPMGSAPSQEEHEAGALENEYDGEDEGEQADVAQRDMNSYGTPQAYQAPIQGQGAEDEDRESDDEIDE
jgi:hypothetical protein